jgi:phosphonate transport system substrate-binding protein
VQVPANALGSPQNPIKMAFVPSSQTSTILRNGEPLAALLSRITGYSFRVSVPTSYAAVVEAIGSNQVDVAWLAPFSYVLAHEKYGAQVILSAVRKGFLTYPSVFLTADANIKSVADFRGKKFAFVDPTSASGYLYPVAYLKSVGLVTGDRIGIEQLEAYFGRGNVLIAGATTRL